LLHRHKNYIMVKKVRYSVIDHKSGELYQYSTLKWWVGFIVVYALGVLFGVILTLKWIK
jgi:hypothetical protein